MASRKVARRLLLWASLVGWLQACSRSQAWAKSPCKASSQRPLNASELTRYLQSTQSVSKMFYDAAEFDRSPGNLWQFNPVVTVEIRQKWMVVAITLSISAMRVWLQGAQTITLLQLADGTVSRLEGGDVALLGCNYSVSQKDK